MNPLIETFLISMVPVIELRGSIPFALASGVPVVPAVCAAISCPFRSFCCSFEKFWSG